VSSADVVSKVKRPHDEKGVLQLDNADICLPKGAACICASTTGSDGQVDEHYKSSDMLSENLPIGICAQGSRVCNGCFFPAQKYLDHDYATLCLMPGPIS
jgi:hypothetical protein